MHHTIFGTTIQLSEIVAISPVQGATQPGSTMINLSVFILTKQNSLVVHKPFHMNELHDRNTGDHMLVSTAEILRNSREWAEVEAERDELVHSWKTFIP